MATEIVALGHKGGIVILADKRTVSRRDSCQPIQHDSAIKIAQLEKTGAIAFAGIAQITADREQTIDLFEELGKLISEKPCKTDEERKTVIEQLNSQYQRAPFSLLAPNVKRIASITVNNRVLYPLYSLLFITRGSDRQSFDIAQASVYFEESKDNHFDCPYELRSAKYKPAEENNCFLSLMGAQSSVAQSLSEQKPDNHIEALKLAACEIYRTHIERKNLNHNDVGSTCDALILSSTATYSIENSTLDRIISGRVTASKNPLGPMGLHLPNMKLRAR